MLPGLINLVVWVAVLGVIFWLITSYLLPLLPEPFQRVGRVIVAAGFILILIYLLLGVIPLHWPGLSK
jgi:hypothetical protein